MNDEVFLETIRQNPDEDAPRLVYADWLEEQGDLRAEFLRLEVQRTHVDRLEPGRLAIRNRMKQLRAILDANWVAWVERTNRHLFFWSNALCRHYAEQSEIGRPLRFIVGGYNLDKLRDSRQIRVGDYIYPVRFQQRRIYVLARMRVCELTTQEAYLASQPADARLILYPWFRQILVGDSGTPLRLDMPLPRAVVLRLRFKGSKTEFGPKFLHNGDISYSGDLQGVLMLTSRSAMDFERSVTGLSFPDMPDDEDGLFAR
jgi:uncharacterized protein (TIGR02996 family)